MIASEGFGEMLKNMTKNDLRMQMLKKRKGLGPEDVNILGDKIKIKFIEMFGGYDTYFIYSNVNNEVKTIDLIKYLLNRGKEIFLPVYSDKNIGVGKLEHLHSLKSGKFGTHQPDDVTDINDIDVAVVPGVVFDKLCNRIGYGSGYYDVMLSRLNIINVVGVGYDFQVVDSLPIEKHDMPVDVIITENMIYRR